MSYPGIQSQRKRDEAARTLRRYRRMRDEARTQQIANAVITMPGHREIARQLAIFDAMMCQARAEGFREALDLWGGE